MIEEDLNLRLGYQVDVTQMAITGFKRKRGELVDTGVLGPEEPPRKEMKLLESEKLTTI